MYINKLLEEQNKFYREYICEEHREYRQVAKIPKHVAEQWLRSSPAFNAGLLSTYMIGPAAEDWTARISWMNKGAFRVDNFEDEGSLEETWLYNHDGTYWVVIPIRRHF